MLNLKSAVSAAFTISVVLAAGGSAQSQATPEISRLVSQIRTAVQTARTRAAGDTAEASVVETVADVIVTANRSPQEALGAVRLAIADEGCLLTGGQWNRWGCLGLSNVAAAIEQTLAGGPAAILGEGGAPISAQPGLPGAGGGADYRSPIGI